MGLRPAGIRCFPPRFLPARISTASGDASQGGRPWIYCPFDLVPVRLQLWFSIVAACLTSAGLCIKSAFALCMPPVQRIFCGAASFVLIGFVFASVHALVGFGTGTGYTLVGGVEQARPLRWVDFVWLSFATLTTAGFAPRARTEGEPAAGWLDVDLPAGQAALDVTRLPGKLTLAGLTQGQCATMAGPSEAPAEEPVATPPASAPADAPSEAASAGKPLAG